MIGDIVDADENTADIFLESGMHCISCPAAMMETLEEASIVHGIPVDELMKFIKSHSKEKAATDRTKEKSPPDRTGPAGFYYAIKT